MSRSSQYLDEECSFDSDEPTLPASDKKKDIDTKKRIADLCGSSLALVIVSALWICYIHCLQVMESCLEYEDSGIGPVSLSVGCILAVSSLPLRVRLRTTFENLLLGPESVEDRARFERPTSQRTPHIGSPKNQDGIDLRMKRPFADLCGSFCALVMVSASWIFYIRGLHAMLNCVEYEDSTVSSVSLLVGFTLAGSSLPLRVRLRSSFENLLLDQEVQVRERDERPTSQTNPHHEQQKRGSRFANFCGSCCALAIASIIFYVYYLTSPNYAAILDYGSLLVIFLLAVFFLPLRVFLSSYFEEFFCQPESLSATWKSEGESTPGNGHLSASRTHSGSADGYSNEGPDNASMSKKKLLPFPWMDVVPIGAGLRSDSSLLTTPSVLDCQTRTHGPAHSSLTESYRTASSSGTLSTCSSDIGPSSSSYSSSSNASLVSESSSGSESSSRRNTFTVAKKDSHATLKASSTVRMTLQLLSTATAGSISVPLGSLGTGKPLEEREE